jgi:hypothetical protein
MIEDIPHAAAGRDHFLQRIKASAGDVLVLSDLMAEAIAMERGSRPLAPVGLNGKVTFTYEQLMASHCMDAARNAYLAAREQRIALPARDALEMRGG